MTPRRALVNLFAVSFIALTLVSCGTIQVAPTPPPVKLPSPSAIKASAIITMLSEEPASAKATILAKWPGYIRITIHGPFGQTAAILISDNERIYAYSSDGAPMLGLTGPGGSNMITPGEVYSMLIGSVPSEPTQGYDAKKNTDNAGRLKDYAKTFGGSIAFSAEFSDYREVTGFELPFLISIKTGGKRYAIKYTSVEVNPQMPEDVFLIPR